MATITEAIDLIARSHRVWLRSRGRLRTARDRDPSRCTHGDWVLAVQAMNVVIEDAHANFVLLEQAVAVFRETAAMPEGEAEAEGVDVLELALASAACIVDMHSVNLAHVCGIKPEAVRRVHASGARLHRVRPHAADIRIILNRGMFLAALFTPCGATVDLQRCADDPDFGAILRCDASEDDDVVLSTSLQ